MTYKIIKQDGIRYIDMNEIDKKEMKYLISVPLFHSIFTDFGIYTKITSLNTLNPPRFGFSFINEEDFRNIYKKFNHPK